MAEARPRGRRRSTGKRSTGSAGRAARRSSGKQQRSLLRRLVLALLPIVLVAAVLATGYLVYLDRTITHTFEGRRWSVPAVVYAQPLELFPGAAVTLADLERELRRLGYRVSTDLREPGTYRRAGMRLDVHLRAFQFMERQRSSQQISIEFDGPRISAVGAASGRPVPLIRLDPAGIGSFFPSHGEDRQVLTPEQVPELLREGLKSVEDRKFDHHMGFDPEGILRALLVNVRAGEIQQGGSTLTQQLVKSYYLDNRQTLTRKLRELAMAVILELRFEKADILNAYINEAYIGQDGARAVHGFGLGAQFYFNRPLGELRTDQIATLIAIIRGPSYYNPFRHPQRVLARRDRVLDRMLEDQLIDASEHERSRARPLEVVRGARAGGAYYPDFMDLVRAQLQSRYQEDDLTSRGLRVFTTLQPRVQDAAEQALTGTLERLENDRRLTEGSLQGAIVVTAHQTGEVAALAGGRTTGFDGLNRVLNARRPVGSLIKPVIYLTALERGYHMASPLEDSPVSVRVGEREWTPRNFDGELHGTVPLVRALGDSLNLATVHLGMTLGVDTVAARLSALTGRAPDNRYPSLLLGAENMTPLEVAGLYGIFASGGFQMPPKAVIAVLDEQGAPVSQHPFALEQRIEAHVAETLGRGLEAVMQRGTGRSSRFAQAGTAGKTGTSDDYRDSWFAGYDDSHLGVVWVGADDNSPVGLTGATGALKVWDELMMRLGVQPLHHAPADDVVSIEYATGLLANADCAEVVQVPIPADAALQSKPGCGITLRSITERLRAWLKKD
ncbi:MAG: penicillin-binding protein 1B [Pseudomonadales bacterium]